MAKKGNDASNGPGSADVHLVTSDVDQAKAAKWFERGRELGEKRQFDYAIEYYVNGLEFWPDAVEEGLKPLHGCAVARRQTGGKKPGFKDTMKRSMTDKNAKQALLNSFWLFGHDPDNTNYMEGIVRNGTRLGAAEAARWAASVLLRALGASAKTSPKQLQALAQSLEQLGDAAAERDDSAFAASVYQMGVDALNVWFRRNPKDRTAESAVRNLSTKLTILKGKYQGSESFRDSIADSEEQKELHDRQRTVQSEDRLAQLISKAETEYGENPDDERSLRKLIDLLTRQEEEEHESRAIDILMGEFERSKDYRHKRMADDVRMKKLVRSIRKAAKAGNQEALKQAQIASLKFDLAVFKERVERYPTDNRVKYEYGVRVFRAGKYDDAIPMFQTARADPKNRVGCAMYLGQCFFRKKYYSQAITTLKDAIEAYEFKDDDLAKNMHYWLGRTQEESGDIDSARDTYGKILQMDYNFKDVRAKMDALPPPG
ncbi:MAG: tetratricopeptide repeat protein [Phycisphaerales bacterium]|nr:MAG: tetratricopeptide repeat protein [Phycisphaerales bacterium]